MALRGSKHPNYGKHLLGETKRKISEAHKGKTFSKEHKQKISESCKGQRSGNWKGGRRICHGYILIYSPTHPYADSRGYIFEHRLVMEAHLGRTLLPTEIVHHINGIKDDNRIENLSLFTGTGKHMSFHRKNRYWSSRPKLNQKPGERADFLFEGIFCIEDG